MCGQIKKIIQSHMSNEATLFHQETLLLEIYPQIFTISDELNRLHHNWKLFLILFLSLYRQTSCHKSG